MIFDKNYLKPNNDSSYFVYQEEHENTNFINPYNDNPYMISSLQKLKKRMTCKKKQSIINECLEDYRDHIVENPQINNVFETEDVHPPKASLAEYARSSYQKVLKDLENIQTLIDKLSINEVNL
ncbi:MAG: hypothetical protein E2590_17315 [Chryseobacterium sp.]|uniref:hypothetical protein n=1 Tax=Epilithonimonas caeni TaxID=365343 RepID=UPI0003FF4AD9|nr:hypothetical protein [Epilithonimonas caeni]MPS74893.1 hypothetical protein [Chryseobacterium sp.]